MNIIALLALFFVGCLSAPLSEGAGEFVEETSVECTLAVFYLDADSDGFGAGGAKMSCVAPEGYVADSTDCNDADATISPSSSEYCDGFDNDCDSEIDENSAVDAPIWYRDADDDGLGTPEEVTADCNGAYGFVPEAGDCNDADATVYGGTLEICNDIDDDCNSIVDDIGTIDGTGGDTFYRDADEDLQGTPDDSVVACSAPDGYVEVDFDCDDGNPDIRSTNGLEICDGIDNDCSGEIDDNPTDGEMFCLDVDGDGFGGLTCLAFCDGAPEGYVADSTDCNDSSPETNPDAEEVCDKMDNDCDIDVDEGAVDQTFFYEDADWDGYGGSSTTLACSVVPGISENDDDCDDNDPGINPGVDDDGDNANICVDDDDADPEVQ